MTFARPRSRQSPSRDRDGGQLLLLAGIILVLGFITTAVTLNEISSMENQIANDQKQSLLTEYRFFRERVGTSLRDATAPSTGNSTFNAVFESMSVNFRRMAQEKGYDFEVRLATGSADLGSSEWNYTSWGWTHRAEDENDPSDDEWYHEGVPFPEDHVMGGQTAQQANPYWVHTFDDRLTLADMDDFTWDTKNDGVIWVPTCDVDPTSACLQVVVVYMRMADSTHTIEEFVLYSLNAN